MKSAYKCTPLTLLCWSDEIKKTGFSLCEEAILLPGWMCTLGHCCAEGPISTSSSAACVFCANWRPLNSGVQTFYIHCTCPFTSLKKVFVTCVTLSSLSSLLHDGRHQAIEDIQERWRCFQHHLKKQRRFNVNFCVFCDFLFTVALCRSGAHLVIVFKKLGFDPTVNKFKCLDCAIKGTAIYSSLTRNKKTHWWFSTVIWTIKIFSSWAAGIGSSTKTAASLRDKVVQVY